MLRPNLNILFDPPKHLQSGVGIATTNAAVIESSMHALRVNAARVQTSLMIKMVSSLDASSAAYLLFGISWNSWGGCENCLGHRAGFVAKICPGAFRSGSPQDFELDWAGRVSSGGPCRASSDLAHPCARHLRRV